MADTNDYLSVYKKFFDDFAATVNPDDQLPVRVAGYFLRDDEIVGEIVDWTLQYLNQKNCPPGLTAPITRQVLDEVKAACKKDPSACGFVNSKHAYDPLRLMQAVVSRVNEVCARYCDNGRTLALPPPPKNGLPISTCAIRNTRRLMEDRHVIIHDFHGVFGISDPSPASYYAVFDGHAGTDAAIYSVSHLHQFLAESPFYPKDPVRALKDAFRRTDELFVEKSNIENLRSGTTVVCALFRPEDRKLYVAWLGDSQALLVRRDKMMLLVNPHKPDRPDERERIENMGGCVMYFGTWRVNGQLAVSRAIGDSDYKPYVCAEPDVTEVTLDGTEDFLVLACDGLWDYVSEPQAAAAVYRHLVEHPDDVSGLSEQLVCLSKEQGSTDNISVIVALLRPARDMDMGGGALLHPPETLRGHEQHRRDQPHDLDDHDDLGPETSVDDGELQRQQLADLDPAAEPRQEAPTPPAASLLPGQSEADNVADSGEDSEDEWNYFKVEPSGKAVDVQSLVQAKQSVCPETTQPSTKSCPDDSNDMESRLNPDAAEFVPSPTHPKPSFEDTIISQSPTGKIMPLDDVKIPSMAEFQQEISQRPGEITCDDLSNSSIMSPLQKDLHNGVNIMDDTSSKQFDDLETKLTEHNLAVFTSNNPFEVSEISSTKAEYGDESATSFATTASDLVQKNLGSSISNADSSATETDFVFSETSSGKLSQENFGFDAPGEFSDFRKGLDNAFLSNFTPIKDMGTISFEVQKEIAPTMEECAERVKLTDDLINPFSHEQPIAESPAEENEQLQELEKGNEANESFEHDPNFTLDAYEVSSPLNPCAPSFDYQRLDETDNDKASEIPKDKLDGVDQTLTPTLEAASGENGPMTEDVLAIKENHTVKSSDAIFPDLVERVDSSEPEKISDIGPYEQRETRENVELLKESSESDLNKETIISSYLESKELPNLVAKVPEKSDVNDLNEKNSEFVQQYEVDNFLSEFEKETGVQQFLEVQSKLGDKIVQEFGEIGQQATEAYKDSEPKGYMEFDHDVQKDQIDNLQDQIGVVEESLPDSSESIEKHKELGDDIEVSHEKIQDFVDEVRNIGEGAEVLSGKPDMLEMFDKGKAVSSDKLPEVEMELEKPKLQQLNFETESADTENKDIIQDQILAEFVIVGSEKQELIEQEKQELIEQEKQELIEQEKQELIEQEKKDITETVCHFNNTETSNLTSNVMNKVESDLPTSDVNAQTEDTISQICSKENEILDLTGQTSPDLKTTDTPNWPSDMMDIPEQLRICVFPLPVKQNEADVELIPPLTDNEEREEIRKEAVEHEVQHTDLKVENLPGEQRDMMETLLNQVEKENANVAREEICSGDIKEKTNYATEEIFEGKDNSSLEKALNMSAVVNDASNHSSQEASSEMKEASFEIKEDADSKLQEDEPNKEIQEVVMESDIRTPPPTPASQAELPTDKDSLDIKVTSTDLAPESTASAVAVAAAAGITAVSVAASAKKEPTPKKLATSTTKDVKKIQSVKETEKLKSTKTSVKASPATAKVTAKTSPISPTKLSVPQTPRTSTPKKTPTLPTTAPTKTAPKVPTTKATRPTSTTSTTSAKPTSVPASQKTQLSAVGKVSPASTIGKSNLKTASSITAKTTTTTTTTSTVRASSAPKSRVSATNPATNAAVKSALTNGDIKPAETKKTTTATTKVAPRSHTAPPRATGTSKTVTGMPAGSVGKSVTQARTGITNRTSTTNGIASKPRVTSSTTSRTAANLTTATDKQHKETANKHISARRVGTVPSKTAPAKLGVKKSPPASKGAKPVSPANGGSPLISAGEGDKKKTDSLL